MLGVAAAGGAQTSTNLTLFNCRADTPMTEMIVVSDLNRIAAKYKLEFEVNGDWSRIPPVLLDQGSRSTFSQFPQLQFDVPYRVRVSVKQSATDAAWSSPGPPSCSFRLRNTVKILSCPAEVSMIDSISTSDLNRSAKKYKVEFAKNGDWSSAAVVEMDATSAPPPPYSSFPQLEFDVPYTVRVSVKQNATDQQWSLAGPTCSFTLRNRITLASCPAVMPMSEMIATSDLTRSAPQYKVEFAQNGDWSHASAITLERFSRATYSNFPQILFDTPYSIRVSVKQSPSSAVWSLPGPVCSLRTGPCPTPLGVVAKMTSSRCDTAGSAVATIAGGAPPYDITWSPGGAKTATVSKLASGTYTVTARDTRGCKGSAQVIITASPTPLSLCISTEEATCGTANDGAATATASGGAPPYKFAWNTTPAQSSASATGLAAGSYAVVVTDANGCSRKGTAVITRRSCTP